MLAITLNIPVLLMTGFVIQGHILNMSFYGFRFSLSLIKLNTF